MKITRIETVKLGEYGRLVFVRVHTDEGIIGLGEGVDGVDSVPAYIHETAAPILLGQDPMRLDYLWDTLYRQGRTGPSRGVEMRGLSALDMALWDIRGQALGVPVYQLLGGACRERIPIYNTCASYKQYMNVPQGHPGIIRPPTPKRPYEDMYSQLHQPERLAESLLVEGIRAMKVWPFGQFAEKTRGQYISLQDLEKGCEPFRRIRQAVGEEMEIALDMLGQWNLPSAIRIAKALEEYHPMWYEDPVPMDNLDTLLQFKESTPIPTCFSENLATRWGFRELFEKRAASIAMLDVAWCGGISEAKRIASMAEAYHLPFAPHDCTGPVTLISNIHLCINLPNAMILETVRAFIHGWYGELVAPLPRVEGGYAYPPQAPGVGVTLRPEVLKRKDAVVRVSEP